MQALYFEELEIGQAVESAEHTVTAEDILRFADISYDNNPLHVDAEFAKTTMFGQQIAHGLLGLSIASGLAWQTGFLKGTTEAFTGLNWKFRAPIFVGDTIHVRAEVKQKKAMRRLGGGFVTLNVSLLNQEGKAVQKGTWTALVRSKPAAEEV
jgi:acyl dehydratase